MRKIRKGDSVVVQKGRDKGREGVVLVVKDLRLLIEGINLVKKHTKPNPQLQQPGGIVEKEAFINISNVAILNQATGKADRIGFKVLENGNKVRVFKSTGEVVDI